MPAASAAGIIFLNESFLPLPTIPRLTPSQGVLVHSDYSVTANTYISQDTSTLSRSMELVD